MVLDELRGRELDRRRLLTRVLQVGGLAALGGPALAACGSSSSGGAPAAGASSTTSAGADLGELSYQLSWIKNVEFAGSYIADQMGIYTANGFSSVNLIGGGPTATPAETVIVTGKAMVGTSSVDATAAAISKGAPLKVIAAQYQKNPFAIMSLAKSPIKTPQDMYGKSIGVQSDNDNVWAAFLKANNLDASKIDKVPVQFDPLPLAQGKVDGWFSFITNEPIDLKEQGYPTYAFLLADFNYPLIGNSYMATTDTIASKRDAVKAFLKSEIQGWQKNIADPGLGAKLTTTVYGKGLGLTTPEQTLESIAENKLITVNAGGKILALSADTMDASVKTLAIGGTVVTTDQLFDMTPITEVYAENPDLAG
jgi:ABC-type nitrate/sulfonate/bicarbonate transport system substrate-binding protein